MFKKWILFTLMIVTLPCFNETARAAKIDVAAEAAVIIDYETGELLYSKNESKRLGMASTTKIMTGIIALEMCKPDEIVTVSKYASYTEGSSIYTQEGEKLTAETLIYGLLLKSGNDAAVALAEHIAGSEEEFVKLMNKKAKELGLKNTSFKNPHGLYAEGHYTTAHELALIARYAMQNETFREIVNVQRYVEETNEDRDKHIINNANKLISMYEEADGIKPGFTPETGRTLVGSAEKDGFRIITVTLNCADDWVEHKKMFDYAFSNFHQVTVAEKGDSVGTYRVRAGVYNEVGAVLKEGLKVAVKNGDDDTYKINLEHKKLTAPVKKNQVVEEAVVEMANGKTYKIPVVTNSGCAKKERNIFTALLRVFLALFGG